METMILFPALDLLAGQCVRLARGERETATLYNPDPRAQARAFLQQGARALHIVDLDAAFDGQSDNASLIEGIVAEAHEHKAFVQLGGGLRTEQAVERWLARGVDRVVLATLALENLPLAIKLCERFEDKIAIALDIREGRVATRGWVEDHDLHIRSFLDPFLERGWRGTVVVTDIARDGMLSGSNIELTLSFAHALPCPVVASGGVGSLADLSALARTRLISGVICGRAIYDGRFSLEEALAAVVEAERTAH